MKPKEGRNGKSSMIFANRDFESERHMLHEDGNVAETVSDGNFLITIVTVVRNRQDCIVSEITTLQSVLDKQPVDYELIVVDNASTDDTVPQLRASISRKELANLRVYALTDRVDEDVASLVGIENAIGDYVAALPRTTTDEDYAAILGSVRQGYQAVFLQCPNPVPTHWYRRTLRMGFFRLFRVVNGIHLAEDAPKYRVLSRSIVTYILRHSAPVTVLRHLPAKAGFRKVTIKLIQDDYSDPTDRLGNDVARGMRLLFSNSGAPLRITNLLCLTGAFGNLLYSGYVLVVFAIKDDIAPGWTTLSLQQSGMFFLLSVVLLIISEYILTIVATTLGGPLYHVGDEFESEIVTRRARINVTQLSK